jgi:hypothetical protein
MTLITQKHGAAFLTKAPEILSCCIAESLANL